MVKGAVAMRADDRRARYCPGDVLGEEPLLGKGAKEAHEHADGADDAEGKPRGEGVRPHSINAVAASEQV